MLEEKSPGRAALRFAVCPDQAQCLIELVSGAFDDLGEPGVEQAVGGVGHGAADEAPAAEALLDHAARRLIDRGLSAGQVAGGQFFVETGQVVLNVGMGVNGRGGQGQFLESRANFVKVHRRCVFPRSLAQSRRLSQGI